MITKEEQNILDEMELIFQWSKTTKEIYRVSLKKYTEFHKKTITELITEAEQDEENINKINKRKIKKRLIQYQLYLQKQNMKPNSIKNYISRINKIYRYHDIEVPPLPQIKNNIHETFEDIPTKQEITKTIQHSRTKMKALISFIASSGLRRSDVANITIRKFMEATNEYHTNNINGIFELISQLQKQELVIPEWHITTQKNGIHHITFSSHESTMYILQMLQEMSMKKDLNYDDRLFGIKKQAITCNFRNVNDRMGLGFKETRRHFHPHSLRKYFATTLTSHDVDYIATQFMLGHSLNSVDSSYFFCDPRRLKLKYQRCMEHLTFSMKMSYVDVTSSERRELLELRKFKTESDERIRKLEELINMIH